MVLGQLLFEHPNMLLVHGACKTGADKMADQWAISLGVPRKCYPAQWGTHGNLAGFKRNEYMVSLGADLCVAFIAFKSRGATHCASHAARAEIPLMVFRYDEEITWL
jgi:hypothetical protein